jgi:hypothetical protein
MSYKEVEPDLTTGNTVSDIFANSTTNSIVNSIGNSIGNSTVKITNNESVKKPKSIFRKREIKYTEKNNPEKNNSEKNQNTSMCTILNSYDLNNMIPKSATTQRHNVIPNNTIEWRWRFFNINNRKLIEISYLDSNNNKRIYTDYTGNKIEYDIDCKWDVYLTKVLYAYACI